ncbi:histone-lysine N-methyltransferase, H3 lysine-79 specific [Anopheles ziemanni]|uniref:histone-lysine N-methyltransferase, H3 lysine-79 specific n=1 Tax=Anopheles ziemanni TaxID=345580 RepID=UPI00265F6582|nr:histone-lysine N-methyltransferase, H3 lysine-79 specific [Anopheles ziemanni]
MDELMELFDNFIGDALQLEKAMEDEFKEFEKKLTDCVAQANERGTPVQNKKRPKRQVSISEKEESTNSSAREEEERSTKQQADKTSFARPSRSAALKAQEKLKEPTLNTKMRNESFMAVVVKKERQSKIESDGKDSAVGSDKPASQRDQYDEMETENDANYANRNTKHDTQQRKDEGFGSTNESSEKDEPPMVTAKPTNREASIMVVPLAVPKVEVLSDEEMPPPKLPPPKLPAPKVRTKKKVAAKDQKLADETASSSAVSSAESSISSSSSSINDTQQGARRARGRPPKASKVVPPAVPMEEDSIEPVRIKTEKLSIADSNQPQKQDSNTSGKSVYEDAQEQMEQHQMRPLQVVLEKIVVPAVNQSPVSVMNGTFPTGKPQANETYPLPPSIQDGTFTVNSPPNTAPCNETFNLPAQGITYQPQPGTNDTFVIEKTGSASTDQDAAANYHKTLVNASIMTEDDSVVENSPNQASMLPVIKPKPVILSAKPNKSSASTSASKKGSSAFPSSSKQLQMKDNTELFNPCIMSPIKSRIQAFEKCASTTAGTLTKATTTIGTPQARVGRVLKTISTPSLATTPQFSSLESLGSVAHSAQAKETVYTPNCATQPLVKAVSASKIHQMQNKALHSKFGTNATAVSGGGSVRSLSRESSSDRAQGLGGGSGGGGTLSAASSTSSLLDEKKKKREEKQRLAAQQREAMEREKREHAERLLREKEEKYRKLVHEKQEKQRIDASKKAKKLEEFEKRRQLEEQRALADQKREALAKQLEQQRIDRELLETLKQSQMKETQETKLHKQMVQQKLRQQQLQQEQQQMAAKKKTAASKKDTFKFEMIDTDDTTDDDEAEDVAARKKKRPPTPAWCQNTAEFRKTLKLQAMVETKVVDRLFSVQPMTPDLRILFPSIDAHKLKRNSSAIWRTPPRQSQIP